VNFLSLEEEEGSGPVVRLLSGARLGIRPTGGRNFPACVGKSVPPGAFVCVTKAWQQGRHGAGCFPLQNGKMQHQHSLFFSAEFPGNSACHHCNKIIAPLGSARLNNPSWEDTPFAPELALLETLTPSKWSKTGGGPP
jgi:hypothetical protein